MLNKIAFTSKITEIFKSNDFKIERSLHEVNEIINKIKVIYSINSKIGRNRYFQRGFFIMLADSDFNFEILQKAIQKFGNLPKYDVLKDSDYKLKTQIRTLYAIYNIIQKKQYPNNKPLILPQEFYNS
jgi:hypothetical protein